VNDKKCARPKENNLKKLIVVVCLLSICSVVAPVSAQQIDVALAGGTVSSAAPTNSATLGFVPSLRGGTFIGFNGDVLFHGNLGVQAEVNWRASQTLYGGGEPYRPLFYDFNAIYAKRFGPRVGAEALGGIGAESIRFYSGSYNCDFYGNCSNYVSSNHFLVDFGGGVRLYAWHNLFVRPEVRLYYVHNNAEFSSGLVARYGASLGYTFGGAH
jgi:hypothetical protein